MTAKTLGIPEAQRLFDAAPAMKELLERACVLIDMRAGHDRPVTVDTLNRIRKEKGGAAMALFADMRAQLDAIRGPQS